MNPIQGDDLQQAMTRLPGWGLENNELVRLATFDDFAAALSFVNRIGELAEAAAHHPDIDIRYNKVRLALMTHDAYNSVTDADIALAEQISGLLAEQKTEQER